MSPIKPTLPEIPEAERTPLVDALLVIIKWQYDRIEQLEDEIHKLKQETRKPKFKSSKMDEQTELSEGDLSNKKKKGPKRSKTQGLVIHEERTFASLKKHAVSMAYRSGTTSLIGQEKQNRFRLWRIFFRLMPVNNEKLPIKL